MSEVPEINTSLTPTYTHARHVTLTYTHALSLSHTHTHTHTHAHTHTHTLSLSESGNPFDAAPPLRAALAPPLGTPYTLQPYTLHTTSYALHPTTYTLHPTPYILHPTPYTRVKHNVLIDWFWKVNSPTKSSTYYLR